MQGKDDPTNLLVLMILEFTTNWVDWGQNTIIYWNHPIGNLYEVKLDLNIKLEWSTTSPEQHVHALTLFLMEFWVYSRSVLTCLYDKHTMKIRCMNWIECCLLFYISYHQMHQHIVNFLRRADLSFFFSLFPSSPFFSLKLIHQHHLKTSFGTWIVVVETEGT